MKNTIAALAAKFAPGQPASPLAARPTASDFGLRSLPNEDVFLFVKPFDNSHIVRESDPGEGRMCWRAFAGTVAGAVFLIGLLLPSAYKWVAGHQTEQLLREHTALEKRRGELAWEISQLRSLPRLMGLAQQRGLHEPPQGKVEFLQPAAQGALAMNLQSLKSPGQ